MQKRFKFASLIDSLQKKTCNKHQIQSIPSILMIPNLGDEYLIFSVLRVEETISILRGLKERYEIHHGVSIKDGAFIGSNSSLVAPVTINENSVVGAGSVITKNVRKKSLALTRSRQIEKKNYKKG